MKVEHIISGRILEVYGTRLYNICGTEFLIWNPSSDEWEWVNILSYKPLK